MLRNALTIGGLFSIALFTACQASSEVPAAAPAPQPAAQPAPAAPAAPAAASSGMRSLRDGVFTTAQAERGEQVFNEVCSDCHSATEWTDAAFLRRWNGQTVHRFFTQIHDTMPNDAPGSLTRQQYVDVLTYIFRLNNLPTGSTELGTDDASMQGVQINWGNAR